MSASYWLAPLSKSQKATGMHYHQETPFSWGEHCAESHARCQQRERTVFLRCADALVWWSRHKMDTEKQSVGNKCTLIFTSNEPKALFDVITGAFDPAKIICSFWKWGSSKAKLLSFPSIQKQLPSLKFHKSASLYFNKDMLKEIIWIKQNYPKG